MKLTGICLLCIYALIRFLPFLITWYLSVFEKKISRKRKEVFVCVRKWAAAILGAIVNLAAFLGMHYANYRDFNIPGYVKNVGGLNFYHADVEYFTISAAASIGIAVAAGFILRRVVLGKNKVWFLTKNQQGFILAAGCAAFVLVLTGFEAEDYFNAQIVIGEICSNNESYVLDDEALIEDYIELYNAGILPCQISGLYLSDDEYHLQKMSLDGYVVEAGGVVVIPCVDDINSFTINSKGEWIYLSTAAGRVLEKIRVGELENDTSYTKLDIAQNVWDVTKCTPGLTYEAAMVKLVEEPVLSHKSGFYDAEFELEIESAPDTLIYYTLDGSIPDEGSYLYEGAVHVYDKSGEENVYNSIRNIVTNWQEYEPDQKSVSKAFLIRAIAVDAAGNKSNVATATYFIGQQDFADKNVLSLIAAPEDLFGGENGIYVTGDAYDTWYQNGGEGDMPLPHFKQEGMEWEREAVFELFEASESVLQQNVGIRIQGNSTRGSVDKRFNVYTRPKYDTDSFAVPLFENNNESRSLIIHTSFIDALNQELMEDRNVFIQRSKPVSLFLNGEFWYEGYLREKYSKDYFEDYCGIDGSNLILYKGGELEEGVAADRYLYQELYDYVEGKDFSQDVLYGELTEKIDVQNYIEFLCSNIYCSNMDMNDIKNVVMFRARETADGTYNDGRWRFALYDMDAVGWTSLNYYKVEEEAAVDSFSQKPRYTDIPFNQGTLYKALRQNKQFCKQFVLTFMDLVNTNFSLENTSSKLQEYGEDITWLNSFFEKRPGYMKTYLAKEFELTGSVESVTLHNKDEAKGTIQINTITPKMQAGSWSGEYYTDYPVTVTAQPAEGYRFVGWSGSVVSNETVIEVPLLEGGIELTAEFQKIE